MILDATTAKLYSIRDVSELIGVHHCTTRNRILTGKLPAPTRQNPNRNGLFYNAAEAEEFIKEYKAFIAAKK